MAQKDNQLDPRQSRRRPRSVLLALAATKKKKPPRPPATFDNVSITLPAPSFALAASPSILSVTQGASGTSTVTVTPQNGFNGSVSLSASNLPNGVTGSFCPTSTAGSSTLTLIASSTATTGPFPVTITGTSGSLMSTTSISLTVGQAPNYSLSALPNSLTVTQGASGTSAVTITPQNGFTGSVSLSASGLPTGVTASFNPASTTGTSTLTLTAGSAGTTATA